jgi:RNA polymerase sigma-70 factor, ECF subfamily
VPRDALSKPAAAELVRQVAQGDQSAFKALFEVYAPRIKTLMIHSGASPDVAEELTRATMLAVWRKARHYDKKAVSVATWIYRLARDLRTSNDHPAPYVPGPFHIAPLASLPAAALSSVPWDAECDEHIAAEVHQWPPEQTLILREVMLNGRSYGEIGERHGLSLDTVKSIGTTAIARLRAVVERWRK